LSGHGWPSMFRLPAYDPVAIASMGFGVDLLIDPHQVSF
jgi:hypothetical protein